MCVCVCVCVCVCGCGCVCGCVCVCVCFLETPRIVSGSARLWTLAGVGCFCVLRMIRARISFPEFAILAMENRDYQLRLFRDYVGYVSGNPKA